MYSFKNLYIITVTLKLFNSSNQMKEPINILELYSGDDLEKLFKGGFINFGYWNDEVLAKGELTENDAVKANTKLYDEVFKLLQFKKNDNVLEVGSGHGSGCAHLSKLSCVNSITGLDFFQKHVDISISRNQKQIAENSLTYLQGKVEEMPFENESFDKIFTIEAFQHFNVLKAISEFSRVLKKNGKLAISTFFATNKNNFFEILSLLPRAAVLSDFDDETNAAMPDFIDALWKSFRNIQTISIGAHVWSGYNKWVHQREPGIWDKNWLVAYSKGLLDYYIVTAEK